MKKILLAAFMVMLLSVNLNAQDTKKKVVIDYYSAKFFNELKATPEQHQQLKDLVAEYTPKFKEIKESTSLSATEKQEKIQPIADERSKRYYAILTPEQYKQLTRMRQAAVAANKANSFK
jgi:Spy/CpxP family protein refolding chaperone